MRYLPWDKLQMSNSIDGGHRVQKNSVFYKTYRSYAHKLIWSPMFLKNGCLFYGEDSSQVETFVANLATQNKSFKSSAILALFDFENSFSSFSEGLEENNTGFEYHPYEDTINSFLDEMLALRNEIKSQTKRLGFIDPPNRKLTISLVHLNELMLLQIKEDRELLDKLIDLLNNSESSRMYFILMVRLVTTAPALLMKNLQWAVFLGEVNTTVASKVYSRLEKGYRSINQVSIGVCYNKNTPRLAPVHPLKFSPSEWWLKKTNTLEEEDLDYENYLSKLDDGTED